MDQPLQDFVANGKAKVSQSGAGTDVVVAGVAGKKVYVVDICLTLDAAGTLKFTEVSGDLTGALNLAANGGIAAIGSDHPVLWTDTAGEDLKITTTTGKAQGWITYFVA